MSDMPVMVLNGARQVGKSILAAMIEREQPDSNFWTFDESQTLTLSKTDPERFLIGYKAQLILDEVQHVPELFLTIKYFRLLYEFRISKCNEYRGNLLE